jgi:hypothetical protein
MKFLQLSAANKKSQQGLFKKCLCLVNYSNNPEAANNNN